jgi:NADH-quinone oxidoreductase subunit L
MHHEQDIRKMGGLKKYMPITYWTSLIGSLALIGFPGSSGFFSKDALIEAVKYSHWDGQGAIYWIAYLSVLLGVFITALYSFRMFFLVFHGKERLDEKTKSHLHEPPKVVTMPLILLAIPSLVIGWITIEPILFGSYFNEVIYVLPEHDVLRNMAPDFHGSFDFLIHSFSAGLAFYLALAGVLTAWFLYIKKPHIPAIINSKLKFLVNLLEEKYYFDKLWMSVLPKTGKAIGYFLWKQGDEKIIDNGLVNGTASSVRSLSFVMRRLQTGYLYHYAFAMILGLISILTWLLWV